jgi:hypothetical protein
MNRVRVLDFAPDQMTGDVVAAFFFADQRPLRGPAALLDWRLNGAMTRLLLEDTAQGNPGEYVLIRDNGKLQAPWVLFAGGGKRSQMAPFTYAGLIGSLLEHCIQAGFQRICLCLSAPEGEGPGWVEKLAGDLEGAEGKEKIFLTIRETPG